MSRRVLAVILSAVLIMTMIPFVSHASSTSKSPFISGTYTHSDIADGLNIHHGVDVSEHQGKINWKKAKKDGVEYAIIRVGCRRLESGKFKEDDWFYQNMEGALAAGFKVGVYFYSGAISQKEAVEEADYVLSRIAGYNVELPVFFDIEYHTGARITKALKNKRGKATNICIAFMDRIKEAGYTPMVYTYRNLMNYYLYPEKFVSGGYGIWIADYNTKSKFAYPHVSWQYTSSGKVNGIPGRADCNFWYDDGTYFGDTPAPDPTPTPEPEPTPTPDPAPVPSLAKVTGASQKSRTVSSVTIKWNKVPDADGYYIYRADSYGGSYSRIGSTDSTEYTNESLTQGREYYYRVCAYKDGKRGSKSSKLAAAALPKYDRYGKTTESDIRMRSHAGTSYSVITALPKNRTVTILASTRDSAGDVWYKVRYTNGSHKYSGYMIGEYFKITKKGTTAEVINMRQSPGTAGKLISTVPKGRRLTIYAEKKVNGESWYKVKLKVAGKTETGWITGTYVKAENI